METPKKDFEPGDPMELVGAGFPGDSDEMMTETILEEFARMGKTDEELWRLFRNPRYAATHRVYRERGERFVGEALARVRSRLGYWRVKDE